MVAGLVLFSLRGERAAGESNIHSRLYVQKLNLPPFAQKLLAFWLCVCLFVFEVIVQTNCGEGAAHSWPTKVAEAHNQRRGRARNTEFVAHAKATTSFLAQQL